MYKYVYIYTHILHTHIYVYILCIYIQSLYIHSIYSHSIYIHLHHVIGKQWELFLHFFFFSLITVARTSRTVLNNSGESGHHCLVPDLRGNAFSFSPFRITAYHIWHLLCWGRLLLFPFFFWRVLIINEWRILSKAFSPTIEIIIWFLSLDLLIWCISLIDLSILKNPCIPDINPTCVWAFWCVVEVCLLKCCWGVLHLCSSVILACSFLFCVVFGFGIKVMVA